MKNFLLGILFTISFSMLIHQYWMNDGRFENLAFFIEDQLIHGNYLFNPLTGRCDEKLFRQYKDNKGVLKTQSEADYFQCDKFQRLINVD